jgi:hypothetical protein
MAKNTPRPASGGRRWLTRFTLTTGQELCITTNGMSFEQMYGWAKRQLENGLVINFDAARAGECGLDYYHKSLLVPKFRLEPLD